MAMRGGGKMSTFHQMGHDCKNLLRVPELSMYSGMVCSPLNYKESEVTSQIKAQPDGAISILDPQLYYPKCDKKILRSWKYYPDDFATADQSNFYWWKMICNNLVDTCRSVKCTHVCSPCNVPAEFTTEYYKHSIDVGNYLHDIATAANLGFFQTAIVNFNSIKEGNTVEMISSVISQTDGQTIYLIIKTETLPRRELSDSEALAGVMKLIHLLTEAGLEVFVAFCSSEFVLWKYAGAKMFATGKFFNLRRFTSSRFDDQTGGGGQLPYWFEENLMAYLREADLLQVKKNGILNPTYTKNPFGTQILEQLEISPQKPWLALSWRKYLYDFWSLDCELTSKSQITELLIKAENNWKTLDENLVFMEEERNDGSWVRQWHNAIRRYDAYIK